MDKDAAKQKALARSQRFPNSSKAESANEKGQRARAARAARAAAMESLSEEMNELEDYFADVNVDLPVESGTSTTADNPGIKLDSDNILDNENLLDPTVNDNLIDPTIILQFASIPG